MLRIILFIIVFVRFNLITHLRKNLIIYKYILLFVHDKHRIEHDSTIEIYNGIAMSYLFDVYYNLFHSTINRNHLFLGQELFLIFVFLDFFLDNILPLAVRLQNRPTVPKDPKLISLSQ